MSYSTYIRMLSMLSKIHWNLFQISRSKNWYK